jgi:hypothetical protein
MNLILHPDIFEVYFSQKSTLSKNKPITLMYSAIESSENKISISKSLLDHYEQNVNADHKDAFQNFLKDLIDNNPDKLHRLNTVANKSVTDEIIAIYKKQKVSSICLSKKEYLTIQNSCFQDTLSIEAFPTTQINKGVIKLNLAANQFYFFSYKDPKSNAEIQSFFNIFFNLSPNLTKEITIFNRDFSFSNSLIKEDIKKQKNYLIKYYSRKFSSSGSTTMLSNDELKRYIISLKKDLGEKLKLFITTKPDLIHERCIILGNYILFCDDDFNNIQYKRRTWHITIKDCTADLESYKAKCNQFNPFQ